MTTLRIQHLACPRCGYRGSFHIDVTATAFVDDGGASVESDYHWDAASCCACLACHHEATAGDFAGRAVQA